MNSYLIAGRASRFERLRMVSSAVQPPLPPEVNQVHQEFVAHAAGEARRVPASVRSSSGSEHTYVTIGQRLFACFAGHRGRKLANRSSAEGFALPLSREETQLLAFFVGEGVTVADLIVVGWKLLEKLTDTVSFTYGVHVGNFVLGEG